jgi:hypothetical protein
VADQPGGSRRLATLLTLDLFPVLDELPFAFTGQPPGPFSIHPPA